MQSLFSLAERCSASLLRLSLGVILGWIGALKFVDPTPVVGLLQASLTFLAFPQFVYGLGVAEVAAAVLLFLGVAQRWVGLLCMGLFSGTLAIFVIASVLSRGLRFFLLAALIYRYGPPIARFIDRYFDILVVVFSVLLVGGFVVIEMVL